MRRLNIWLFCIGAVCLVTAGAATALVKYYNGQERVVPLVFSNYQMLHQLWEAYKFNTLEPGTYRTLDKTANNVTTSEGQSYTMLRAAWMDDRTTFDRSWQWTRDILQRPDKLFAWKFGQLPNGDYGIQTNVGGQNTASDADSDIALALLMAYSRWNEPLYLDAAKPIIAGIWEKEVVEVGGKPVLTADDLERNSPTTVVVNPSYFAPYSYKVFHKVDKDPKHDWLALADNSYEVIKAASSAQLDKSKSVGLPPDWMVMDRQTGAIGARTNGTNYSYDALRTPFRLALDYQWFHDNRARQTLAGFKFLNKQWQTHDKLRVSYGHDGSIVSDQEGPAMYGGSLGYFLVEQPITAQKIYHDKLQRLYSADKQKWRTPLGYYDDNWAWFSMALAQKQLPNLTVQ